MAEGSTTSSLTSQTLSFVPGMAAHLPRQNGAVDVSAFFEALNPANRHTFLQPPPALPIASLQVVKDTLDAFAGQISDEQLQRLKLENKNKKRKRLDGTNTEVLKIRKVHLDGFETGQVWQQARRIIQSALAHSEEALLELVERDEVVVDDDEDDEEDVSEPEETELASTSGEEDGEDVESLEGDDSELEDDMEEEDGVDVASDDDEETFGGIASDEEMEQSGEEEEEEEEEEEDDEEEDEDDVGEFVEDPHGLNDGFFSIDDFNKQTQWFEEQDAKGDPNTDAASDDEEINWDADPLDAKASKSGKSSKLADADVDGEEFGFDQEEDDDEEEEDGPTFGNMDLNAPEGDSEDEAMGEDEEDVENNANNVFYKDFFAPPPRKASKDKKGKNVRFKEKPIAEEDVERAMRDVRRDLFEDESDIGEDSDDVLSDVSAGEPRARRSAHERRQAKLSEEIRKLEAAAVAKREWAMSGEAAAVDRPVNSLLDEQLDFEHAGKPIPVITQEITDSIEELIKRRILAQEFDEVLRRRPDAASVANGTRRGLVEVDDTKSSKGLAEIYEEEHQKNLDPDGFVSKADEKTQKEEAEIARMWKDLNATLDSLSSWQYRPRPQEPTLNVVTDTPTITMEDAQPSTAQGVAGGESALAPQEVYKAGGANGKENVQKGEVVAKSGLPVARAEMSREDKQRRRRREKERIRKAGADGNGKKPVSKRAQMEKQTMADLKKGGVKVINRKGEVVDMAGNKAKAEHKTSTSSFKL